MAMLTKGFCDTTSSHGVPHIYNASSKSTISLVVCLRSLRIEILKNCDIFQGCFQNTIFSSVFLGYSSFQGFFILDNLFLRVCDIVQGFSRAFQDRKDESCTVLHYSLLDSLVSWDLSLLVV